MLPSRDSLSLGERAMAYLPRCADTDTEVREVAIQVCAKRTALHYFVCYSMFLPFYLMCNFLFPHVLYDSAIK